MPFVVSGARPGSWRVSITGLGRADHSGNHILKGFGLPMNRGPAGFSRVAKVEVVAAIVCRYAM